MASESIDPSVAKRLLEEGAVFIFHDVPVKTEFGIDLYSWNTGEKFKGLKMIPPGLHFIYFSAVSKDGQTAPRTGFYHNFKRKEILVKKWDKQLEDIIDCEISEEELERYRSNIKNLDSYLGPYPYDVWKDWVSLTGHITDDVLNELMPLNNKISSVSELVPDPTCEKDVKPHHHANDDPENILLPKMCIKPGTEIRFTKFPEYNHPLGSCASEISKHNMDLSFTLQQVMKRYTDLNGILGEFQFAFVSFVVGHVYDAFENWKHLLNLLCSCDDALNMHHEIFNKFISTLHFQLKQLPKDFFVDIISKTNFLTQSLQSFFLNLKLSDAPQDLKEKGGRFCIHLTKKFKWDFDGEPDEEAPVVVDM